MRHLLEQVVRIKLKDRTSEPDVLAQSVPQAFGLEPDEGFTIQVDRFELQYEVQAGQVRRVDRSSSNLDRVQLTVTEPDFRAMFSVSGRLVEYVQDQALDVIERLDLGPGRSLTIETPDGPLYFKRSPDGLTYQPEYPNYLQMFRNFVSAVARTVRTPGPKFASAEAYDTRRKICQACEFWDQEQDRCTKCGCFARAKLMLAAQHCPINRWGPTTAVDTPPDDGTN